MTPISQKKLSKVLTTLQDVLEACPQVLIAGEPGRLAAAILANLSLGRLDQSQVASWTSQLTVKGDGHLAYPKQLNIQALFSQLYLHLDREGQLSNPLKQALLAHPHLFI